MQNVNKVEHCVRLVEVSSFGDSAAVMMNVGVAATPAATAARMMWKVVVVDSTKGGCLQKVGHDLAQRHVLQHHVESVILLTVDDLQKSNNISSPSHGQCPPSSSETGKMYEKK